MSTLQIIITELSTALTPYTVSMPANGGSLMKSKESATQLFQSLQGMFPAGQVSPLHADQDGAFPEALYRLDQIGTTEYAGFEVAHVSGFDVSVRSDLYAQLCEKVDEIELFMQGQSGFDVVDSAEAYDDLRKAYRADLAIDICRPVADVVVMELSSNVIEDGSMGKDCIHKDYLNTYAVIHHAADFEALTTLKEATENQLDNYKPTGSNTLMLQSGEMLPAAGGLVAWVNTYTHHAR